MPKKDNPIIKKFLVISSGLVFLALMILPSLGLFSKNSAPSPTNSQDGTKNAIPPEKLRQMAQGYEKILQREPNNLTALQGLAQARLQLKDYAGAREPLEKLYKKYPQDLQVILVLYGTRLQTNDVGGAKTLLEKLVKLYPQEPKFKEELKRLNQAIAGANQEKPIESKK